MHWDHIPSCSSFFELLKSSVTIQVKVQLLLNSCYNTACIRLYSSGYLQLHHADAAPDTAANSVSAEATDALSAEPMCMANSSRGIAERPTRVLVGSRLYRLLA